MEVHFTPELEKKLSDIAAQTGRPAPELVQDVIAGSVEELGQTRNMLDTRYDDIKSGMVKLSAGDEVFARLRKKSEARKLKPGS